jgi:hypothetical protein
MIEAKYVVIIILTNVAAAFWFGIIFERANWNKLIRDGVLPKPKNSK